MYSLEDLRNTVVKFRNERDWEQFHTPRNLATALNIEASELQELFLWLGDDEIQQRLEKPEYREAVKDEMADVFAFLLHLADVLKVDLGEALEKKMEKNRQKYPVGKSYGSAKKYNRLES